MRYRRTLAPGVGVLLSMKPKDGEWFGAAHPVKDWLRVALEGLQRFVAGRTPSRETGTDVGRFLQAKLRLLEDLYRTIHYAEARSDEELLRVIEQFQTDRLLGQQYGWNVFHLADRKRQRLIERIASFLRHGEPLPAPSSAV